MEKICYHYTNLRLKSSNDFKLKLSMWSVLLLSYLRADNQSVHIDRTLHVGKILIYFYTVPKKLLYPLQPSAPSIPLSDTLDFSMIQQIKG